MIPPFFLHQPESVEAASMLLARHGSAAKVIAGGSEMVMLLKAGLARADHLIDIKGIPGLNEVEFDGGAGRLRIGSLVTYRALGISAPVREHFPLLWEMAREIGNIRVRNVGTLGGNLCFADLCSDPATLLTAYDAQIRVGGRRGERRLGITDFLQGSRKTALDADEILLDVAVPKPCSRSSGACLRFCPWERSTLSIALLIEWHDREAGDVRLAVGGVGPTPRRLSEIEEQLRKRPVDEISAMAEQAGRTAAALCTPLSDIWNSAAYKRHLVAALVARAIGQACGKRPHV